MTTTPGQASPSAERRRRIAVALLRALTAATVLVALYYLAPLNHLTGLPLGIPLAVALLVLLAVTIWQIRAITQAAFPEIRAIEALATTAPLFLLLYAATYFLMAQADPASFSTRLLTRTDALYYTVTVFTTVGFGDISATSQSARLLATTQMILDLLVLGLGIRVFLGAIQLAHRNQTPGPDTPTTDRA
ncbi:potassium channel family protein [Amycolatopsis carbonis]|uniref:Potassium channel family protein n=1 Tax=Amycolatopsis carbonis TaxID=715471 RepID=A0A9Y2MTH2_9PSEU|nr:potassium channel family protein [Amycolatopsis sp. 2-15]WIX76853.1 potassium channel family protein [Amycolatopsis sp. 2-15]